jgi:putative glutamine amidotransferase
MFHSGKPVIGTVADVHKGALHAVHSVHEKYLDAVSGGADAIVLVLPALINRPGGAWTDEDDLDQVLDMLDGVFLTGAISNVAPERYGARLADPASPSDPARDHVTLSLVQRVVERGMPLFGVCRGFQEINVALGGTLHQAVHDTPGFDDHRENKTLPVDAQYGPAHEVSFAPGGMLHLFTGAEGARVNSLHGQGIDRLAPGLVRDADAPDGLIEAFRSAGDGFVLGVQWHPEWGFRDDAVSLPVFRAFGNAARAYRATRLGRVASFSVAEL